MISEDKINKWIEKKQAREAERMEKMNKKEIAEIKKQLSQYELHIMLRRSLYVILEKSLFVNLSIYFTSSN